MSSVKEQRFKKGEEIIRGGETRVGGKMQLFQVRATTTTQFVHWLVQVVKGYVKAVRVNLRARQQVNRLLLSPADGCCCQAFLGRQGPGAIVGELSLLLGGAATASVMADSDQVVLYTINEAGLKELLALRPALSAACTRWVACVSCSRWCS